jgi:glycosyltransferase involved in cell wall biosynthesis
VGPVGLTPAATAELRSCVEIVGPVPRSKVLSWLSQFDVFLFPSTCEGSAGAVSEALASGLPTVTSVESGSVISDDEHGFVCRYDDVESLTDRVERLASEPALRDRLSKAARARAEEFGLEEFSRRLGEVTDDAIPGPYSASQS